MKSLLCSIILLFTQCAYAQPLTNLYGGLYRSKIIGDSILLIKVKETSYPTPLSPDTIRMQYFDVAKKFEFYNLIKGGSPIDYCYVNFPIYLDSLFPNKEINKEINNEIYISNSYIKCLARSPLLFRHPKANKNRYSDTIQLEKNVTLSLCSIDTIDLSGINFKKETSISSCFIKSFFNISDFKFSSRFEIYDMNMDGAVNYLNFCRGAFLDNCDLLLNTQYCIRMDNIIFKKSTFIIFVDDNSDDSALIPQNMDQSRFYLHRGFLSGHTKFSGNLSYFHFYNVSVYDTISLDNVSFSNDSSGIINTEEFTSVRFANNLYVMIYPQENLIELGFRPASLAKMTPIYKLPLGKGELSWQDIDASLENNIISTELKKDWLSEDKEEIGQRFRYFRNEYRMLNLSQNRKSLSDLVEYCWLATIRTIVNHGYHGLGRFSVCFFIFIMLFAVVFMSRFRHPVTVYVNSGEFTPYSFTPVQYNRQSQWINWVADFFRCIWFSFVVFVNPRLPSKYFKFSNGLIALLFLEWLIGLFFLYLFIVYILSHYSFVKALFAL